MLLVYFVNYLVIINQDDKALSILTKINGVFNAKEI
jgi:hypothetical protein